MGILSALSTSVAGLSSQSYALENISGNIANSSTVGFKRVDTSFVDLIPDAPVSQQAAGSVQSLSQLTNTLQGTLSSTGVNTNMALTGDGYFTVAKNTGSLTQPSFAGANLYTRRGDFALNTNGYLVNGAGYYLAGTSYAPSTGAPVGGSTTPLKIDTSAVPAKTTTTVRYSGNIPFTPRTTNYSSSVSGSELLKPADFGTNPVTTGTVVASDNATFLNESIPGGEVSVYNASGVSPTVQTRWAKTASSLSGGTDTWQLFYQTNSTASGSAVQWKSVGTPITFNASGTMTSATPITITGLTVDGVAVGNVALDLSGGLTQYGASSGTATPTITQDGYTSGTLSGLAVNSDGSITGNYTNGQSVKLGQVTVAHFKGDDAMKRENGGAYSETTESGPPTFGLQGTTLSGGSVEQSNTDISTEFSKMIVTQQAYSANTKVMSTAQQMLQDVINILR